VKLILLEDVKNLGQVGDQIEVKDGYARNYLIPRNLAMQVTAGALRVLEEKKKKRARLEEQRKAECEVIAEKVRNASCTISMEAGEEDKLFGSVTAEMIGESLKAEGVEIDKKTVVFEEPIKKLGVYNVNIKLHPEVIAELRVWVVKK